MSQKLITDQVINNSIMMDQQVIIMKMEVRIPFEMRCKEYLATKSCWQIKVVMESFNSTKMHLWVLACAQVDGHFTAYHTSYCCLSLLAQGSKMGQKSTSRCANLNISAAIPKLIGISSKFTCTPLTIGCQNIISIVPPI